MVSEESGFSNQDMSMHGSLFRSDTDVDGGKGRKFDESTHGSHGIDVSIHSIREATSRGGGRSRITVSILRTTCMM